jgi:kumamolisin
MILELFERARSTVRSIRHRCRRRAGDSGSCHFKILALFLCGVSAAVAQSSIIKMADHTPREILDGSAVALGSYDSAQMLRLVIGLTHPRMGEEEEFVTELADRHSANYRHFLTADQWIARFAPAAADEAAVIAWAQSNGLTVTRRFPNRLIVEVEGPARSIEQALSVKLNSYQLGARKTFSNDRDPTSPSSLANIIQSIGGLNNIQIVQPASNPIRKPVFLDYDIAPTLATRGSVHGVAPAAGTFQVTGPTNATSGLYAPSDLFGSNAYNVAPLMALNQCCDNSTWKPELTIAIATAGVFSTADLVAFTSAYGMGYSIEEIPVGGDPTTCGTDCNFETTMDVEWATAWSQSPKVGDTGTYKSILVFEAFNPMLSTFTEVYEDMLTSGQARIMSTSWGCAEFLCTPSSVIGTDHGIFYAMIAQGWTIIAASGDSGATASCVSQDAVSYPASDVEVLAAGGTSLALNANDSYLSEQGWSGYSCATNNGGSGGGFSHYFTKPGYQNSFTYPSRGVPDIALNANPVQAVYYNREWWSSGGTSIVAPELAGFFVQANAYLDRIATETGTPSLAPITFATEQIYLFGVNPTGVPYPHNPFYDITAGCNANDITAAYSLTYYCASPGLDQVTGWGSFNALQLAWAYNFYFVGDLYQVDLPGYTGAPQSAFTGPPIHTWYNSNQNVSWTIHDSNPGKAIAGVAGYSADWDTYISDSASEATPGTGDGFYTGPLVPNATTGQLALASAGQGCHTAQLRAWDNAGVSVAQSYGPVCYDTIPPATTVALSGAASGGVFSTPVTVALKAVDASSGVKSTLYSIDAGLTQIYAAPFTVSSSGAHTIRYHSIDVAGNVEATRSIPLDIAEAGSAPAVKLSTNAIVFANQAVNTRSPAKQISLTNSGTATLVFTSISIKGGETDDFTLSKSCGTTLAPGASCTMSVQFTPIFTGPKQSSVSIVDNAKTSPQIVSLSGTSVAATVTSATGSDQ